MRQRSTTKEFIDLGPSYYTRTEYEQCLEKLFRINQLLGFYSNAKKFLRRFAPTSKILDIGCGSGLFLLHLSKHFNSMTFTGIDNSFAAINHARKNLNDWQLAKENISFEIVASDYVSPASSVDIILATLLCHHLTDEELIHFFRSSLESVSEAVLIYDLQRSWLAYGLYKVISPLFRNRLINHDGLLSIKRAFKKKELIAILQKAEIKKYSLSWHFPFCWRIVLWKKL